MSSPCERSHRDPDHGATSPSTKESRRADHPCAVAARSAVRRSSSGPAPPPGRRRMSSFGPQIEVAIATGARRRGAAARRADALRPRRLDGRQCVGSRAGRRPVRDQAVGCLVRRPRAREHDPVRPRRQRRRGHAGRERSPSSDTAAHAYVYRNMPEVGGVVHTHSTYATAWAARGEEIPCVITAMADEFGGPIPVGPFAIIGDDSIGRGIVETLTGHRSPCGADAEPRPVHDRRVREGRREGGGHGRGRRAHRAPGTRGRPADPDPAGSIDRLYDRYQNVYGQATDARR